MRELLSKEIRDVVKDVKLSKRIGELGIITIGELCNYSRMELSQMGLENLYINDLIVALQLNGLDLKPNHAKKNNLLVK